ncbi:KIP1-like protein [Corchorus capsularis]|uniref:KIP1-like protein n=1 Tax=Corchorus capsularis TaxID=210143 RepID=A0A1R3ISG8_COCAP|nr:KIP1-like protein [Corchorus capsularis]
MDNNAAASSWPAGLRQQSQWLHIQTTLSDLEGKMKAVMTLLEQDNSSACQKADISFNRKSEVVRMLGEVNRSYSSLVEKYDQLMSKSQSLPRSGSSSMSNSRDIQQTINQGRVVESSDDPITEASDSCPESVVDDPDFEHYSSSFEYLNKLADDLTLTEQCSMSFNRKPEETNRGFLDEEDFTSKINGFRRFKPKAAEFRKCSSERENIQFQFTKLMEENLRQQAELLRRNEEKRETIKELRLQLEYLKSENRTLQKCLGCSKMGVKRSHSQTSRSKGLIFGKFFSGGCS